jgi:hypothetical protein
MLDTETTGAESAPKKRIPVWTWRDAIWKSDLPSGSKLVCLAIAEFLSDAGETWRVPVKTIMEMTGFSNRVVAAHLKTAKKAGVLVIKREMGPHGRRGITRYAPKFPDHMDLDRNPAEFMDGQPSDETTRGAPSDETSPWTAPPSDETSFRPSDETSRQISSHQEEASHQQRDFPPEGDAQARPTAKVEKVDVVQPQAKKTKAGKVDLLGEPVARNPRNTRTLFPDDAELAAEWLAYGIRLGMTEEDAQRSIIFCAKHYESEGKRKANWTPCVEAWLLKDRETNRKRANGTGRPHQPSWHELAERNLANGRNRFGEVVF